jgi:hypothetical protein
VQKLKFVLRITFSLAGVYLGCGGWRYEAGWSYVRENRFHM